MRKNILKIIVLSALMLVFLFGKVRSLEIVSVFAISFIIYNPFFALSFIPVSFYIPYLIPVIIITLLMARFIKSRLIYALYLSLVELVFFLLLGSFYSLVGIILGLALTYSLCFFKKNRLSNPNWFFSLLAVAFVVTAYNHPYSLFFYSTILIYSSVLKKENFLLLSLFTFFLEPNILLILIPTFLLISYGYILFPIYLLVDFLWIKSFDTNLILVILVSLLLLSLILVKRKKTSIKEILQNISENFNHHILNFASFLDEYSQKYLGNDNPEYMKECFSYITGTYCTPCQKNNLCFKSRKAEMYTFIKSSISYGKEIFIKGNFALNKDFTKFCPFSDDIISKGNQVKVKIAPSYFQKNLETQIEGITSTLRQYAIDMSKGKDMNLYIFLFLKEKLIEHGFEIILFDVKKASFDDFLIDIGLANVSEDDINYNILKIIENCINTKASLSINQSTPSVIYVSIYPQKKYFVQIGQASLAKNFSTIKGDCSLVKPINNNLFVAISDGMGSGLKAQRESKKTLDLVRKIIHMEINTQTILNMLNTFYSLRNNDDEYATLDFLKIDLSSGKALLYKMGSSNTYLIRNEACQVFENSSLPFGMNDLIKSEELILAENDLIVLASDGIVDYFDDEALEKYLISSIYKSPQSIAYEIIDILTSHIENPLDDMTIIALKIEKTSH